MDPCLRKEWSYCRNWKTEFRNKKATSSKEDADITNERSTTITLENNKSVPSCSEKQPIKNKRKYYSQYLSCGLTSIGDEKAPDALCIFCHTILANSSLAPAKLQRHMETRHCKSSWPSQAGFEPAIFGSQSHNTNHCAYVDM